MISIKFISEDKKGECVKSLIVGTISVLIGGAVFAGTKASGSGAPRAKSLFCPTQLEKLGVDKKLANQSCMVIWVTNGELGTEKLINDVRILISKGEIPMYAVRKSAMAIGVQTETHDPFIDCARSINDKGVPMHLSSYSCLALSLTTVTDRTKDFSICIDSNMGKYSGNISFAALDCLQEITGYSLSDL